MIAFDTKDFQDTNAPTRASLDRAQCFDSAVNTDVTAKKYGLTISLRDFHAALNTLLIDNGLMANVPYCSDIACGAPFDWVDSHHEEHIHRFIASEDDRITPTN